MESRVIEVKPWKIRTQCTEKLKPITFERVRALLSSGIIIPVTGPAPSAKVKMYLQIEINF
jgi:hypothetical protein